MPKIVIYTFDGTASPGASVGYNEMATTLPDGDEFVDTLIGTVESLGYPIELNWGGGFPATLAKKLVAADPQTWEWYPVEYFPHRCLSRGWPIKRNHDLAISLAKAHMANNPDKKIVLSGLSQGTTVVATLYNELRYGDLIHRKDDLVGIVNFGDVRRAENSTIPLPGALTPPGGGSFNMPLLPRNNSFPLTQSYGPVPGRIQNPDPFYWSLSHMYDPASAMSGVGAWLTGQIGHAMFYGPAGYPLVAKGFDIAQGLISCLPGWIEDVFSQGESVIENILGFPMNLALFALAIPGVLGWMGLVGMTEPIDLGPLGYLDLPAQMRNWHAQYGDPYPYTALSSNPANKSAITIGYEYLLEVGARVNNLTVIPKPVKPVFFYAVQTARIFPFAGLTDPLFFSTNVAGLDGEFFIWAEKVDYDPFPDLLDDNLWITQRISYPASAVGMEASIRQGVEATVAAIQSYPIGTPIALGGYSQGGAVMHRVYDEFRSGRLAARRADLRAVVTFGAPTRETDHTYPGSSGWSGAFDVANSTRGGHGAFPASKRVKNTEDFVWDFVLPGDVFAACGDSATGAWWQAWLGEAIELNPVGILGLIFGTVTGNLQRVQQSAGNVSWVDPYTGASKSIGGGNHSLYPYVPPPTAGGVINTTAGGGDTCYQVAAKYLRSVGQQIRSQMYPQQPAAGPISTTPVVVQPTTTVPAYSWFTSLPGG